jgi:hypothetical protein
LFFLSYVLIFAIRQISSSRPITGSSFPALASSFRFFAYLFNELYVSSAEAEVTLSPFQLINGSFQPFSVTPWSLILCYFTF